MLTCPACLPACPALPLPALACPAVGGHVLAHASTVRLSVRKGKAEQRLMKVVDAPNLPGAIRGGSHEHSAFRDFSLNILHWKYNYVGMPFIL